MLERLLIRNYQRHRSLTLDLSHSIVTLTGRSDAGKSAVLRALRWLMTNSPSGDSHVRHGARGCRVSLLLDGGREVSRTRSGKENSYTLDGEKYASFGQSVPDDILAVLNVDEVSWQGQLDSPFLLCLSPPDAARALNRVVNLDLIDASLSRASLAVKRARTEVELGEKRLRESEEELEKLGNVEEADRELRRLESVQESILENRRREALLRGMLEEGRSLEQQIETLSAHGNASATALRRLERTGERLQAITARIEDISTLVDELRAVEREREQCTATLAEAEASLMEMQGEQCPACGQTIP